MLAGIVVSNAILLVDYTNILRRRDGMPLAGGGGTGGPDAPPADSDDHADDDSGPGADVAGRSAKAPNCRRRWRGW